MKGVEKMINQDNISFKLSLKAVRTNLDLNQKEMAEKLDVSPCTWFNWEKGITKMPAMKLKQLSIVSKIPEEYIFLP